MCVCWRLAFIKIYVAETLKLKHFNIKSATELIITSVFKNILSVILTDQKTTSNVHFVISIGLLGHVQTSLALLLIFQRCSYWDWLHKLKKNIEYFSLTYSIFRREGLAAAISEGPWETAMKLERIPFQYATINYPGIGGSDRLISDSAIMTQNSVYSGIPGFWMPSTAPLVLWKNKCNMPKLTCDVNRC